MSAATETVEPVLDAASEAILEGVDGVVETIEVVRGNPKLIAAAGVVGIIAGGVGGYFIAQKKLKSFYEDLAQQEIAEAKAFYANIYKTDTDGEVLTPMDVMAQRHGVQAAADAVKVYQGKQVAENVLSDEEAAIAAAKGEQGGPWDDEQDEAQMRKIEEARLHSVSVDKEISPHGGAIETVTEKVQTTNVFTDPTFDMDEELKYRTKDKPYVLHHDEFYAAERDYDTQSLTYYKLDNTLADERDKAINDVEGTVGEDNLARFGSGSKDRNMLFVRNERLEIDYEITQSEGSYLEEVLGLAEEDPKSLKHSDMRDQRRALRDG